MSDQALLLEGISKSFPRYRSLRSMLTFRKPSPLQVLKCIDLDIRKGSITAITGPNGSGKTTILRIITGTLIPDSGKVRIIDTDPVTCPADTASLTGFLTASERSFYWRLSVKENLRFFGKLQGLTGRVLDERIETVLEMTSSEDIILERFAILSTGYRQRLSLARALLHDPPLLILDEPTRSLDPETADAFREQVIDLARNHGKTILMTTHNREDTRICDEVRKLDNGYLSPNTWKKTAP